MNNGRIFEATVGKSNTGKPVALLVLGMHRSGTSALTRTVSLLGVKLPRNLLPAHPSNPTGHWESEDWIALGDELLRSMGATWDTPLPLDFDRLSPSCARAFREGLIEIFRRDFADADYFVAKDPRICRLAPLWLEALTEFGADARVIICLRDPREVASSLAVRNRTEPSSAALVWLRHVLEAERSTRGIRRAFVFYPELLRDWRGEMERISRELAIEWPRTFEDAAAEIDEFLSPNLRHHVAPAEPNPTKDTLVERTWRVLQNGAVGDGRGMAIELDELARTLDEADRVFAPLVENQANRLRSVFQQSELQDQKINQLQADISWRDTALNRIEGEVTRLSADVRYRDDEIARMQRENERLQGEVTRLSADARYWHGELDRLQGEVARLSGDVSARDAELVKLKADFNAREVACSALVQDLQARLDAVHSSTSWRLTAPLRALRAALSSRI